MFQSQSAATEHPLVRWPRRRVPSVCRLQHVHELHVPNHRIVGKCLISLVRSAPNISATPGNLDTEQPFSYCYELPTQLRLESVANAHTAADLHVRSWVSYRAGQESHGRRERSNKYTMRDFSQSVIRRAFGSLRLCCNAAIAALHTKFLNPRTESLSANLRDSFRCTRKIF